MVEILKIGDAVELLKNLKPNSIDLVLTDPPWNVSSQIIIHRSVNPKKYKYKGKDISLDFGEWDKFKNDEQYWGFTKNWFSEVVRTLRKGGHLITFFDQNKVSYLIDYARKHEMMMRQHLYWLKTNPVPRARKVDFMVALEHAVWFTKKTKSRSVSTFNYKLGQQKNYVKASLPNANRYHPTQKPERVLEVWVKYLTKINDWVLDPFAGSGSTGKVCQKLQRNCIMFEKNLKWRAVIEKRLSLQEEKLSKWFSET